MKIRLVMTLVLALALLGLLTVLNRAPAQAQAAGPCDRYVMGNGGSDVGDCSSMASPCRTVQYAINHAVDDDTICVASHVLAGTTVYHEHLTITRTLTLSGAWEGMCVDPSNWTCSMWAVPCAPDKVVLNGFNQGRVITIRGNIAPKIDCFTITEGNAAGWGGDPGGTVENDAGGGIYSKDAAPIIVNNVITANYGCDLCPASYGRGGGIYLINTSGTTIISGNVIANNVADNSTWGQGGGIMLRNSFFAQVQNNEITGNRAGLSAGYGGGMAVINSNPHIMDNVISGNVAGQAVSGLGGGIFIWHVPQTALYAVIEQPVTITLVTRATGNRIFNNIALASTATPDFSGQGGGVYSNNAAVYFYNNTVFLNNAALVGLGEGGGLYLRDAMAATSVVSNTFINNHASWEDEGNGGGLYLVGGSPSVRQNRIEENYASANDGYGQGGGILVNGGAPLLTGNRIVGNYGSVSGGSMGAGLVLSGTTALVQDNWILRNRGSSGVAAAVSGAGVNVFSGAPRLVHNQIISNTSGTVFFATGGGVYVNQSAATLDRNTIVENVASGSMSGRGGGVRIAQNDVFTFTNNIVARNQSSHEASGLSVLHGLTGLARGHIAHNTITENRFGDGVGVWLGANVQVTLTNNIIINQSVGISNTTPASTNAVARYTLFESNGTDYGSGVTSSHEIPGPAALTADFRLLGTSNAINAGMLMPWIVRDIDGDLRPMGAAPDVGADEYVRARLFLPLVLRQYP